MRPITVWQRYDLDARTFVHNHIEDGHSRKEVPCVNSPQQASSWRNGIWRKAHGVLSGITVEAPRLLDVTRYWAECCRQDGLTIGVDVDVPIFMHIEHLETARTFARGCAMDTTGFTCFRVLTDAEHNALLKAEQNTR